MSNIWAKYFFFGIAWIVSMSLMAGCGNNQAPANDANQPGVGSTETIDAEIQSSDPRDSAKLLHLYEVHENSRAAIFLAFYQGQRYLVGLFTRPGNHIFRSAASLGSYSISEGRIHFQVEKTTCPQLHELAQLHSTSEDPRIVGSPGDDFILLHRGSTTVSMKKVEIPDASERQAGVVKWGCFSLKSGSFTAHEWVPVSQ